MKLDANDRTLRQVLNTYFFFVPRYQRPYSWTAENVDELWEDAIQESDGDYFIGSMVTYPRSDDTVAIIDGQQRITTLTMLLCAIRDAAEDEGLTALADGTHTFIERKDENAVERFILKTETSFPYLHDEILSRGEAELDADVGEEESAIQASFGQLSRYVEDTIEAIRSNPTIKESKKPAAIEKALKDIRDKILNLRIVLVEVGDEDEATTIFVTLNSRGKDLEPADLIKAHLLQLLPGKGGLDRPREKWEKIIDLFDQSQAKLEMTPFLLAVWGSRYETVTAKKLARAVRKKIKKAQANAFLDDLVSDSKLYRSIFEPEYATWTREQRDAVQSLLFLREFGIRQPMPLVLSLVREVRAKRITTPQLKRALRAIEDYHFTYSILASKTSTGGMSLFYAKRARDLLNAKDKNARSGVINELVKELKSKRPSDVEFDEAFSELWLTDDVTSEKKVVQYVLRRAYVHHNPKAAVDFAAMTIEHVASQKDSSAEVGRLGNLIYVNETLNSQLGHKTFGAKKKILKTVKHQWIPPEITSAKKWDDAAIQSRTASLAVEGRTAIWKG